MKKLLSSLGLMFMMAFTLTGCELYFGKKDGGGNNGGGAQPGWDCAANADCAAGCYCAVEDGAKSGKCEEAGFCDSDSDCPDGYTCDDRSSCVPNPVDTCETNADCDAGAICNNGVCEASCVCQNDAEAQAAGWAYCDEQRKTCMPANEESCGLERVSCGNRPECPVGQVALKNPAGCYTGNCGTISTCDVEPHCSEFQHEVDCFNGQDSRQCTASYTGINCTKPDGSSCQSGDAGCTCESFVFAQCR